MKIIAWDDLVGGQQLFPSGTAISIGGFDGPHRGHECIFSAVLKAAAQANIPAGLITFRRSPRFIKSEQSYAGDVSTLDMRLQKFAERGFAFTVLIDFSADFARMRGSVFFGILLKTICIKYLAVGSDFTCGYRHDTGVRELRQLAPLKGFCFDSIEQLYSVRHERISSSAIRQAVEQADFTLAKDLLGYPFFLDVTKIAQQTDKGRCSIEKSAIEQILPRTGAYSAVLYLRTGKTIAVQINITDALLEIFFDHQAAGSVISAETPIHRIEFIRKE